MAVATPESEYIRRRGQDPARYVAFARSSALFVTPERLGKYPTPIEEDNQRVVKLANKNG